MILQLAQNKSIFLKVNFKIQIKRVKAAFHMRNWNFECMDQSVESRILGLSKGSCHLLRTPSIIHFSWMWARLVNKMGHQYYNYITRQKGFYNIIKGPNQLTLSSLQRGFILYQHLKEVKEMTVAEIHLLAWKEQTAMLLSHMPRNK